MLIGSTMEGDPWGVAPVRKLVKDFKLKQLTQEVESVVAKKYAASFEGLPSDSKRYRIGGGVVEGNPGAYVLFYNPNRTRYVVTVLTSPVGAERLALYFSEGPHPATSDAAVMNNWKLNVYGRADQKYDALVHAAFEKIVTHWFYVGQ